MPNPVLRALAPILLVLLAACIPVGPGGDDGAPKPAPAGEISVTALPPAGGAAPDAAVAAAVPETEAGAARPLEEAAPEEGAQATNKPESTPSPAAEVPDEAAPPPPPSPEALACQRRGGSYVAARSGGPRTCVKPTGEGAKRCTRETDCTGLCLARSGTCSPVTPLIGCNEILQADGRRATLCIE